MKRSKIKNIRARKTAGELKKDRFLRQLRAFRSRAFRFGRFSAKDAILMSILIVGVLTLAAIALSQKFEHIFYAWIILAWFGIVMLYAVEQSSRLYDLLFFVPARILLAGGLAGGYIFIVANAIQNFFSKSLTTNSLIKNGLVLLVYMIVTPLIYSWFFKLLAFISIRVFKRRPYFQRYLRGDAMAEYYFKNSERGLPRRFIDRDIHGLFVYPDEPLFLPALRAIKRKLGEEITPVSLSELAKLHGSDQYKKYFELLSRIRPEINNPNTYWQMFPFVVLISHDSVREFDLGAMRSEKEITAMVAEILREKELSAVLLESSPEEVAKWYDRTLETLITARPFLGLISFLGLFGLMWRVFRLDLSISALGSAMAIIYVDAAFAVRRLIKEQRSTRLAEQIVEEEVKG